MPLALAVVRGDRLGDFTLRILFDDGIVQTIDFVPFLRHSHHPAVRVFLSPPRFQSLRIEYGDLVWGDYELCFPSAICTGTTS